MRNWEAGRVEPSEEHKRGLMSVYRSSMTQLLDQDGPTETQVSDPDLLLFLDGEWEALDDSERELVKGAIKMARNSKVVRERQSAYEIDNK